MPLSFAADILPLFRDEPDIMAMKRYGHDLSSHEEVKEKAKEIYETFGRRQHALRQPLAAGPCGAVQALDG